MPLLGEDGYPVPDVKKSRSRFACICPICVGATANMSVAKSGNWIIRCPACTSITYLNDVTSINLFRGLQRFLDEDPDHQIRHAAGIVRFAPDEGA